MSHNYGHPEKVAREAERIIDQYLWGLCNEIEDALRLTAEGRIPRDSMLACEWDDVSNVYPDPSDWSIRECQEWLEEHGHDSPDDIDWTRWTDAEIRDWINQRRAECDLGPCHPDNSLATCLSWLDDASEDGLIDDQDQWRACVDDHASEHPAEILQWFRVDSCLASWLDDIGECVVEWGSGWAWGRQCCGQHVILDGTFQQIARNLLDARGEDY